jgi:hypothetical protein
MPHFDNTLGALLTSLMVSLTLYGITLVQTYVGQSLLLRTASLKTRRDILYYVRG